MSRLDELDEGATAARSRMVSRVADDAWATKRNDSDGSGSSRLTCIDRAPPFREVRGDLQSVLWSRLTDGARAWDRGGTDARLCGIAWCCNHRPIGQLTWGSKPQAGWREHRHSGLIAHVSPRQHSSSARSLISGHVRRGRRMLRRGIASSRHNPTTTELLLCKSGRLQAESQFL
jgi:hypothetical protein